MRVFICCIAVVFCAICSAGTIYVNNVTGNDRNDGSAKKPVASIWKALTLVKKSGVIEVANTGKVYQSPYPGPVGKQMNVFTGGTPEKPLEIRGNGAVITGLSVIPHDKWKETGEKGIYSLPFWPMSNMYKGMSNKTHNFWPDTSAKIWWVNGKAAPNCKDLASLKKTPGGFWWNKAQKQVLFSLPAGKKLTDLKIELPANSGFYIIAPYVIIRDFYCIFSWNDGFDTTGLGYDGIYRNCVAINNCGQGFSCHATGSTLYEDCAAIGCNSSGSCDIDQSYSRYIRCIFLNNTFEAGVYTHHVSQHFYGECIIAGNMPFEQIWLLGNSSQHYFNCLIEGTGKKDVIKPKGGTISFRCCTIRGGQRLFTLKKNDSATVVFQNCFLGGTEKELFVTEPNTFNRLQMKENAFFDAPGFIFKGTAYTPGNLAAYRKANKSDAHSVWIEEEPKNIFRINKRKVGAHLPASVLKRYEQLKKIRATAAGIHFEK